MVNFQIVLTCLLVFFCRCIDALVKMGVLVANSDRTAVRRTADFFLKNFQVCFAIQRVSQPSLEEGMHQLASDKHAHLVSGMTTKKQVSE